MMEETMMTTASTVMPSPARVPGQDATGGGMVTRYPVNLNIARYLVAVPIATRPAFGRCCDDMAEVEGSRYYCDRRPRHRGRHAAVWWSLAIASRSLFAPVRAVWGDKDQAGVPA